MALLHDTVLPAVLVVEDEPAIADTVVYALSTEGFAPTWVATAGAALQAATATPFALAILDVGLPDLNGFELYRRLVQVRPELPVIFLTARSGEIDRVVGLELGADDYVAKPFSPRELVARVRTVLRRFARATAAAAAAAGPSDAPRIAGAGAGPPVAASPVGTPSAAAGDAQAAHGFVVDDERKTIRWRGVALELPRYEYRLLKLLVERPGRVWSRDELMQQVWDDPGASFDRTVDAHIKTLRAKLRAIDPHSDPIQTHRGMGYALRESA
jgi:two-component system catabolic regulation response regulator CreB